MKAQRFVLHEANVEALLRGTLTIDWPEHWRLGRIDWDTARQSLSVFVYADEFVEVGFGVEPPTLMTATEITDDGARVLGFEAT